MFYFKMTTPEFSSLLQSATGPSRALDKAIAKDLHVPVRDYSSSVDTCLELIHECLPKVHWHVGRAADGLSAISRNLSAGGADGLMLRC